MVEFLVTQCQVSTIATESALPLISPEFLGSSLKNLGMSQMQHYLIILIVYLLETECRVVDCVSSKTIKAHGCWCMYNRFFFSVENVCFKPIPAILINFW